MHRSFIFILLMIHLACQPTSQEEVSSNASKHFDIPAFFAKEARRLSEIDGLQVEKTIIQNGKKEVHQTNIENWKQELAFFSKNKIHEITLQDQYKADSLVENGKLTAIHYTTENKELATQKVSTYFEGDNINKIEIESQAQNAVYETTRQLTYQPHIGYKIQKGQKVVLFEEDEFLIELKFLNE